MSEPVEAPYGSWVSPISAERVAGAAIRLGELVVDGGRPYWLESRPAEGGRQVVVTPDEAGGVRELTPIPFNARTRVHEYGGGSLLVADGVVWFSNFADQRIWAHRPGEKPEPLTPEARLRYADCELDRRRRRLLCVREDHRGGGEAVNAVAAIPLDGGEQRVLFSETDFVAYPRLDAEGRRLAWIGWDHPNMPWDDVQLWVAEVGVDGGLTRMERVNTGISESIVQPTWSAEGALYFVSDRGGWWNLHRLRDGAVEVVLEMDAEFAGPLWGLGQSAYRLISDTEALVTWSQKGFSSLGRLDLETGTLAPLDLPWVAIGQLQVSSGRAFFLAGSADDWPAVVELDLATDATRVLRRVPGPELDPSRISRAEPIEFATTGGKTAHAFFYPPANPGYRAPAGTAPPLLVSVHGGPTASSSPSLSLSHQFWTSRGFAVVDVNYGGSTGYGREYRKRLDGAWGVVDLDDAVNAARHLADSGCADPERLIIHGGSAGGYTTLAALAFRDVFAAGGNYYGVSDLELLAKETHKFESRYLDGLIGPWPERADLYRERAPIHHLDGFSAPLIVLQGLEDAIVPPSQSEKIVEALRARGVPVAYLAFEGEQHGFRRAETIARALEAELWFYGRVLGFAPAGEIEPVEIDNLP